MGVRVPPTAPILQKYLLKFLGLFIEEVHRVTHSVHNLSFRHLLLQSDVCQTCSLIPMVISSGRLLSKDPLKAEALSKRLSDVLEGAWSATTDAHQ